MLRKLMLLAATMMVMSLLAVTPAFAQQGTTFDVVCNIRAQGGEGMVIIVSSNEQSDVLVRLAGPFETRAEARVAAEAFGGVGATGCNENPPPPPPPGPGPDRDRDRDRDRDFFGVPFADVDVENEAESGPVDLEFSVTNTGDYASQCVPALQFGNTGNFNNAPTLVQGGSGGFVVDERNDFFFFDDRNHFGFFDDDRNDRDNFFFGGGDASIDDFEPGGIEFSVSPELSVDCSHTVQQSSAASSTDYWHTSSPHWW